MFKSWRYSKLDAREKGGHANGTPGLCRQDWALTVRGALAGEPPTPLTGFKPTQQ